MTAPTAPAALRADEGPAVVAPAAPTRPTAAWIHRPSVDLAVALCWVPFALAGWVWGAPAQLGRLLAVALVLSLAHQPLTLALVYGDPGQFSLRRRLFTWGPVVFAAAVVLGLHVSLIVVAAVAGLWNAEHTVMQRYGLTRIYGRKAGQQEGGLEKAMLLSWLAFAAVWAAAQPGTAHRGDGLGLGGTNERSIHLLAELRPGARLLLVPVGLVVAGLLVAWVRAEARRWPAVNPAKHLYLASTALLFALIVVQPVIGIAAYVGSHAIEYVVTVHQHLGRRYQGAEGGGPLGGVVRSRAGRTGFVACYLVAMVGVFTVLRWNLPSTLYTTVLLTAGGLHFLYDGVIWKLRRPAVARGFAIGTAPSGPGTAAG